MAAAEKLYDLMLLLRSDLPDERQEEILQGVRDMIAQGGGAIQVEHDWGLRALTFEIDHRADAHYELIQFTGPPALLESLRHSLRITDGVLRHRIIKVAPGTPPPPEVRREPAAAEA